MRFMLVMHVTFAKSVQAAGRSKHVSTERFRFFSGTVYVYDISIIQFYDIQYSINIFIYMYTYIQYTFIFILYYDTFLY